MTDILWPRRLPPPEPELQLVWTPACWTSPQGEVAQPPQTPEEVLLLRMAGFERGGLLVREDGTTCDS